MTLVEYVVRKKFGKIFGSKNFESLVAKMKRADWLLLQRLNQSQRRVQNSCRLTKTRLTKTTEKVKRYHRENIRSCRVRKFYSNI